MSHQVTFRVLTKTARLLPAALFLLPSAAWAHPGHIGSGGVAAGMAHPLTGIDHIVAMVLVGVWAGMLVPKSASSFARVLALPGAFVGAMLMGFTASAVMGPGIAEPMIIASVIALGAAAALRLKAPVPLAMIAVGLFGFAHGLAHGFETPSGAFPVLFAAGFTLSTAALHGLGLGLSRLLPMPAMRALGFAGAGIGVALAAVS